MLRIISVVTNTFSFVPYSLIVILLEVKSFFGLGEKWLFCILKLIY